MDYTLEGEEFFKKTALQAKLLFIPFKANSFRPKFLQSKFFSFCSVPLRRDPYEKHCSLIV